MKAANDPTSEAARHTTAGVLMIGAGVVLLLVQRGVIHVESMWLYWPVVLMGAGLVKVVSPRRAGNLAQGIIEILAGLWFLACNFHWQGFTYRETWPLVFVAIGLSQVFKALGLGRRRPESEEAQPHA